MYQEIQKFLLGNFEIKEDIIALHKTGLKHLEN